jgi:two-component system, NarL family, sensor kinase
VGLLEVEERPGAPLDRSARTLLHDLAAQAAIAAQAVLLAAELQRSRARLLEAVEQERRRLRRDLHDGLGTSLVGVVMQLEAVSNLVNPASPAAALVKTIESEARQLVTDTRRLVHGLAPPVVEEVGLVEAIRLHADRLNRTGGRRGTFQLRADSGIDGLPAAVEIAAYIIATEAMTNVARHARASSCTVVVSQNSRLHIEVLDDGVGIGPAPRTGVGLNSMHERTDELGGALVIESVAPRGTRVAASLPLDLR